MNSLADNGLAIADYVVVGTGSAGSVLAERLSADLRNQVVVVEAGGRDTDRRIRTPVTWTQLFRSPIDWDYLTEPQAELNGREIYWPRGKTLGGSSSMNAMMWVACVTLLLIPGTPRLGSADPATAAPQIHQINSAEQTSGRLGQQDLTSAPGGHHPRSTVEHRTEVVGPAQLGFAGRDAHPHRQRQLPLRGHRGIHRRARRGEGGTHAVTGVFEQPAPRAPRSRGRGPRHGRPAPPASPPRRPPTDGSNPPHR
jgi:choline dehydrogenase-like flavoprotein